MENHTELSLSALRRYIICYGAKYMEAYQSDLYYDCKGVENLKPGESVFWMVSACHTYLYSAKHIHEYNLDVGTVAGNRFNYRIDCIGNKFGECEYAMTRVLDIQIAQAVNEYQSTIKL